MREGLTVEEKRISLFVPGRLCIIGEHSDWAGMYRTVNSNLKPGAAIVTGIEQGIYACAERSEQFEVTSSLDVFDNESFTCPMDSAELLKAAQRGGFFSYVAGVASYICENFVVGGVKITITKMDLPIRSGLSSSAAICVLAARAFNVLYGLQMNVKGEMQAAFRGEQRTPSRCGRMDQACAYGRKPVFMTFDGMDSDSRELKVGATMHWVVANLMAEKDTIKILADLNRCFPFAEGQTARDVQTALGEDNLQFTEQAKAALERGDAEALGKLMNAYQDNFDRKVMPACAELAAPVLHSILNDQRVIELTYGRKGVGSQGDGSVQLLAKDEESAAQLLKYLTEEKNLQAFPLTLHPGQSVKKAIIPLAGFGTRVFPATKCLKKCFLPIFDRDHILKPALLIMLEELRDAGIEEICLVIGEEETEDFEQFFAPLPQDNYEKLPQDKKKILKEIVQLRKKITFVTQKERLGFGHAVWSCREFTAGEPVLLMLGDFLYRSNRSRSCCRQLVDAFVEHGRTLVSLQEVAPEQVVHYGILTGKWEEPDETIMNVEKMVEKPTNDYAREYLGVQNRRCETKYYATFGQYVLTQEVFDALDEIIHAGIKTNDEFQLTDALEAVRRTAGMDGFLPDGKCYDIGLPEEYYQTFTEFPK